jgi:prepilin-type N-terminal cleavage/methylation domain-containing protein
MRMSLFRPSSKSSKGFTLLELMVAVVIVGILATVAIFSYKKWSQRARSEEAIMFLNSIKQKQEVYFSTYRQYASTGGLYPQTLPDLQDGEPEAWDVSCPTTNPIVAGWCDLLGGSSPAALGSCATGTSSATNKCTYHQYQVVGWSPTAAAPDSSFIQSPNRKWWYAIAQGDVNANGDLSQWFISNEVLEVYNKIGGEL